MSLRNFASIAIAANALEVVPLTPQLGAWQVRLKKKKGKKSGDQLLFEKHEHTTSAKIAQTTKNR